jgi:NADH-quinone oxidoreductase subunit E
MDMSSRTPARELIVPVTAIDAILDRHGRDPAAIIAILQDLQEDARYLPEGALRYIANQMDIPLSRVCSLVTFYRAFSLEPRGRHHICVCTGTACHVRGSVKVLDTLERELGIRAGETDSQMQFTLETVNCLGACALGPVVVVDGEYHGEMTPAAAIRLLKHVRRPGSDGEDHA